MMAFKAMEDTVTKTATSTKDQQERAATVRVRVIMTMTTTTKTAKMSLWLAVGSARLSRKGQLQQRHQKNSMRRRRLGSTISRTLTLPIMRQRVAAPDSQPTGPSSQMYCHRCTLLHRLIHPSFHRRAVPQTAPLSPSAKIRCGSYSMYVQT